MNIPTTSPTLTPSICRAARLTHWAPWAARLMTLGAVSLLVGCGSPVTIDSAEVPNKARSEARVPDIHQEYVVTHNAQTQRTHALAQFRVHSSYGDSIRFNNPGQVRFGGMTMDIIDGDPSRRDPAHQLVLLLVPILALIQTGTFYQTTLVGLQNGPFVFTDDFGHEVKIEAPLPDLELPKELPALGAQKPYQISFQSRLSQNDQPTTQDTTSANWDDRKGTCTISATVRSAADGLERSHTATARATFDQDTASCIFGPEAHPADPVVGQVTLRVDVTREIRKQDAWERDIIVRASHVAEGVVARP